MIPLGLAAAERVLQPLRVEAEMAEPVIYYGDGIHLDGVLSFGAFLTLTPDERAALPALTGPVAEDFDLPLARWEAEGVWGWRASAAHAAWTRLARAEVRKRPAAGEMVRWTADAALKVDGGPLKAKDMVFPTAFASRLTWYCVGDPWQVRDLLGLVPGVGKLIGHGHGIVRRWTVTPWHSDWSVEREGRLTRRMPRAGGVLMGAIRAPYHHRSRVAACDEPDFMGLLP